MRTSDTTVFARRPGSTPAACVGPIDRVAGVGCGEGRGDAEGLGVGVGDGDCSADGSGVGVGVGVGSAAGRVEGASLALDDNPTDALGATLTAGAPAHAASVMRAMTAIARDRTDRRIVELL
jgi:hypothetical protein